MGFGPRDSGSHGFLDLQSVFNQPWVDGVLGNLDSRLLGVPETIKEDHRRLGFKLRASFLGTHTGNHCECSQDLGETRSGFRGLSGLYWADGL